MTYKHPQALNNTSLKQEVTKHYDIIAACKYNRQKINQK